MIVMTARDDHTLRSRQSIKGNAAMQMTGPWKPRSTLVDAQRTDDRDMLGRSDKTTPA
jgi:hypothetical protein